MPVTCPPSPTVTPTAVCPLVAYLNPGANPLGFGFEIIGAALLLYQLTRQFDLWEEDIENLQELAECYRDIGICYKEARLALRDRDQEVYDYQNSRPSYPGPCDQRIQQARLNALAAISRDHEQALKALPSWACGDKTRVDYDAARAEVESGMHNIADSRNWENNQEDRYEQMRVVALARSAGGAIPNLSGAFRSVSAIAEDNLRRSTASFNSAFGAFGNAVASISNKYLTPQRQFGQRAVGQPQPEVVGVNRVNEIVINRETLTGDEGGFSGSEITALRDPED